MKKPLALTLLALLALAGCSRETTPPANNATNPAPASTPPAPAAAPPAATAPTAAPPPAASAAAAKPAGGASGDESALDRAAALPAQAKLPAGKWVAGTNYRPLVPAQPTDTAPGKVEVVEMFWYACPHCYALDPYLESWRKSKPAYIDFRRVPVTWGEIHRSHARFFYTLQALGKEEAVHSAVFSEMHEKKNYMFTQGNERASTAAQVAFAKTQGISEADFMNAYNSFTVQTNLQKADELVRRYKVEGVPLLVINGKYLTDVTLAGNPANVISIISDLAASEKRH
jgi:protein dithiol oxidoreductase (disulfide-forming)